MISWRCVTAARIGLVRTGSAGAWLGKGRLCVCACVHMRVCACIYLCEYPPCRGGGVSVLGACLLRV